MIRRLIYVAAFAAALLLGACFNITVNVYFPEKDVKSAFKSLEQQLMKGGVETPKPPAKGPAGVGSKPEGRLEIEFGARPAYAQDVGEMSQNLADIMKDDPEVIEAYKNMGGRLGYVNRLRDQGAVGEGNDGLLKPRGQLGRKEGTAVEEENADRKKVIHGMAKAILMINNQPQTRAGIAEVRDKAAGQFAALRAESARPGWWVQKADGSWARK